MRDILAVLVRRGGARGLLLVVGSEFGAPGGNPGTDALLLVPEAALLIAVSVRPEPRGVPTGVVHVGGGSRGLLALLDEQIRRAHPPARADGRRGPGVDLVRHRCRTAAPPGD